MKRIVLALALAATAAAGCGPKRTAAASQPTPAAFDSSKSDPKALANADAMLTALGGYDKWTAIKELDFELKHYADGKLDGWFRHKWDRWNGRHRYAMGDAATLAGDADKVAWLDVRYDIYNDAVTPFGIFKGKPIMEEDARKQVPGAKKALSQIAYPLFLLYKLRDPGVHLADGGDVPATKGAEDLCQPSCVGIKVTFDPEVGTDTWQVDVNSGTHLPQMIEKILPQGRLAFRIDQWADAGGLKWPAKLTNVGMNTEWYEFLDIGVTEPRDSDFDAPIDRTQGDSFSNNKGH
jgi:hypothetical protein